MIAALIERLRRGDRNALARLISLAARGEHLAEMQAELARSASDGIGARAEMQAELARSASDGVGARVVAFTGSGGVGKSSLIGKLISVVRDHGHKVAVLACDPQSPLSGGALLGDRFRMGSPTDDGVFIRSLAALSGRGAVADHLDVMIRLLEAFNSPLAPVLGEEPFNSPLAPVLGGEGPGVRGLHSESSPSPPTPLPLSTGGEGRKLGFDVIFIETVGSGQGDVEVRNLADVVVLLLQPESGDDVQWEKAGILECADVVVIHKADLPTAEQTAAQVRAALDLSPAKQTPVLRVSTKANRGYAELWQVIEGMPLRRHGSSDPRALLQACADLLAEQFHEAAKCGDENLMQIIKAWQRGELATRDAVLAVCRAIGDG